MVLDGLYLRVFLFFNFYDKHSILTFKGKKMKFTIVARKTNLKKFPIY